MRFLVVSKCSLRKIIIFEKDGKLDLKLNLNGNFPYHKDYYDENGEMINKAQESWWYDSDAWERDVDDVDWDEIMIHEVY